ncbi:MAG: hypothetical protein ACTHN2_04810 [Nitrobacter sp.]
MPSVVATVAGAYIVNHYVVSKPADAPLAAAVSTADPAKAADVKASDGATHVANIPEAGVRAKGISEKAIERTPVEKVIEKPVRPAEAANRSEEPKRHPQAQREKTVAKVTPAETVANPDEGRDATDLARAAIERLRGTSEPARAQELVRSQETAPRQPEPPRVAVQETPRAVPSAVQPLPPAIMVSTPRTETISPQSQPDNQRVDPRRPIPPADSPEASRPLDIQANADLPAVRAHTTTVADDVLSAAKSVFQAVLPR